jgi:hypothetical protein
MFLQAGAMLGDSFLHQLPHAFGMYSDKYYVLFVRIFISALMFIFLRVQFCFLFSLLP